MILLLLLLLLTTTEGITLQLVRSQEDRMCDIVSVGIVVTRSPYNSTSIYHCSLAYRLCSSVLRKS